jgi:hypothetical protein
MPGSRLDILRDGMRRRKLLAKASDDVCTQDLIGQSGLALVPVMR